jgi:hypothetical protein
MSTRCNIIVRDDKNQYTLYHHRDGYPDGVGKDLYYKFKSWTQDSNKLSATKLVNKLLKDKEDDGYELTTGLHADIEYLYEIDCIYGYVKCRCVRNWDNLEIIEIIDLSELEQNK